VSRPWKRPLADEARGQRNGRQYRITTQPGEFSLVKNKGGGVKEDTEIIIRECQYVCQGKQRLVQLSRQAAARSAISPVSPASCL